MILVDFNALFYQCVFASVKLVRPKIANGTYLTNDYIANAKYDILDKIIDVQNTYQRDYGDIVLCIDCTASSNWRRKYYSKYKSSRKSSRDTSQVNFTEVFKNIDELVNVLDQYTPWKVIKVPGAEADDVILSIARKYAPSEKVLIISSDKDMIQAQKFGNVKQYSLLTCKFITPETKNENSVDAWITEHIILGDAADEIPKVTDETEFTDTFKDYLSANNYQYTEESFESLSDSEKDQITQNYDVWATNKAGERTHKAIYNTKRFGPSTLKKMIKMYGSVQSWLESNPLYMKHYQRNKRLISYEGIPRDIYNDCIITYQHDSSKLQSAKFKKYLIDNHLGKLIPTLPSNFLDANFWFS